MRLINCSLAFSLLSIIFRFRSIDSGNKEISLYQAFVYFDHNAIILLFTNISTAYACRWIQLLCLITSSPFFKLNVVDIHTFY